MFSRAFPLTAIASLSLQAGCAVQQHERATMTKHVTVSFCVEPDASVSHAHVIANPSADAALGSAALNVIRHWKFVPARNADGKPILRCGVSQDILFEVPKNGVRVRSPVTATPVGAAATPASCFDKKSKPLTPCACDKP